MNRFTPDTVITGTLLFTGGYLLTRAVYRLAVTITNSIDGRQEPTIKKAILNESLTLALGSVGLTLIGASIPARIH